MLQTNQDLEGYLARLNRRFEQLDGGTFVVSMGPKLPPVLLRLSPPVLVAQVAIAEAPADSLSTATLFRKLLEHNAEKLMHAAYGIENQRIVLSAALALENLDLNELEAVLNDIDMALAEQVPTLIELGQRSA